MECNAHLLIVKYKLVNNALTIVNCCSGSVMMTVSKHGRGYYSDYCADGVMCSG